MKNTHAHRESSAYSSDCAWFLNLSASKFCQIPRKWSNAFANFCIHAFAAVFRLHIPHCSAKRCLEQYKNDLIVTMRLENTFTLLAARSQRFSQCFDQGMISNSNCRDIFDRIQRFRINSKIFRDWKEFKQFWSCTLHCIDAYLNRWIPLESPND